MNEKASKRIKLEGVNDKRQINAVIVEGLKGEVQLVYEGMASKCYLIRVYFLQTGSYLLTHNHWCNEETMPPTSLYHGILAEKADNR